VLGHIYRVHRKGAPKVHDPRGNSLNWASLTLDDLVSFLADPRPVVRKRAIRALAVLGNKSVEAIGTVLRTSTSTEARRNALWALTQIDSDEARKVVRSALRDNDNTVRHVAALSVSLWRDPDADTPLLPLLQDEDAQVRRSAAEALGRIGNPVAIPSLLNAVSQIDPTAVELPPGARILEHSIIFALMEINDRAATADGLGSENPRVRRAALIATDQMRDGHLDAGAVAPLLVSKDPVLRDTAKWIAARHSDWGGALAGFFQDQFKTPEANAAEATDLQTQLVPFAADPAIMELLAKVLADGNSPKWSRLVALRTMAKADTQQVPDAWLQQVAETVRSPDADLVRDSIATARAFGFAKAASPALDTALKQIGNNADARPEIRLEALVAAAPLESVSTNLFDFLLNNLDPAKPWLVRNNAASVIGKATLDRAQLIALADALRSVGPAELTKLIKPFEISGDEAAGISLVENLKTAKAVSSLRLEFIKPVIEKFSPTVQAKASALFAMLGADAVNQKEHVDQLLAQLPQGDIRRGQILFNNPKFACVSCHSIGYRGGHLGPDLTSVGTIRTERDLLESIVYPSASFVRSYEPMSVLTRSGDDYTGILRKDAPDEVILATGPDAEIHIRRSDISEMRQGTVSLMPQGLDAMFSKQELADLVAFLKDTKWGAR
jgi:putative heme-binding domain-containing protein